MPSPSSNCSITPLVFRVTSRRDGRKPTTCPAIRSLLRQQYVGAYEMGVGRAFMVSFENGNMYVTPPGGSPQLYLQSGTTYKMGNPESTTTVTFNAGTDGARHVAYGAAS